MNFKFVIIYFKSDLAPTIFVLNNDIDADPNHYSQLYPLLESDVN